MKPYIKTKETIIGCLLTASLFLIVSCGSVVTDIDGNTYKTVSIGDQEWMAENLRVSHFSNGDPIPEINNGRGPWSNTGREGKPAWCYLDTDPESGEKYGKLYNWYAVEDPRGLCPAGWRLPDHEDWEELIDYLGGLNAAGDKMKSASGWEEECGGTNESGFSGLPGGYRHYDGRFNRFDATGGYWWSSTQGFAYIPCSLPMYYSEGGGNRYFTSKGRAFSVRCIRD